MFNGNVNFGMGVQINPPRLTIKSGAVFIAGTRRIQIKVILQFQQYIDDNRNRSDVAEQYVSLIVISRTITEHTCL